MFADENAQFENVSQARKHACTHAPELPSLPINREISRKYSKINPISRSPAFDLQSPAEESFVSFFVFTRIFRFVWPAHSFASCESSTVHGKCREQRAETIYKTHIIEHF